METLAESGRWFKNHYPLTPATAVTVPDDYLSDGLSAVWYDSRYYRAGLLWEDSSFVIRDIHLFDESIESDYLRKAGTTTYCEYITPPVVDGFIWSTPEHRAGLRLVAINGDSVEEIPILSHGYQQVSKDKLLVTQDTPYGKLALTLSEESLTFEYNSQNGIKWALDFTAAPQAALPFESVSTSEIKAKWKGYPYALRSQKGSFQLLSTSNGTPSSWRILPLRNQIRISFKRE